MKVIIIKANLKDGLSIVERASGENLNLPILKNTLIETDDNKIKLIATNLEVAITYSVPGKVIEGGKVTVPIHVFLTLMNALQSERLNLEKKGNGLEVKTENYHAVVQGLLAEDFPLIPKIKNKTDYIEIKTTVFKEALGQAVPSAQFSDLRPELSSVLFSFLIDDLKIVATDSFRLSEKTIPNTHFKTNHKENFNLLIPLKTSQELLRILQDDEEMRVYHDHNQILFVTERLEFISRLTEGTFPDYTAIVPKKFDTEVHVERQEFMNAIKLAGIFSARVSEVKVRALENKKSIEVSSSDQTIGENKYLLSAKIQGKPQEVSFNWKYLMDGLRALKTDEVFLGMNEENKPALIKSPRDASFFYILMPILKT